MSLMSDLDIALAGLESVRLVPWSTPTLSIQVTDDASLKRAVPHMWRAQVNRWLAVEYWCMGASGFMSEATT